MQKANLDEITGFIKKGMPVLTVNTRLSRHIRKTYDARMKEDGHGAWETPVIMPLFAWMEGLWGGPAGGRPLLSSTRRRALWERIVSGDGSFKAGALLLPGGITDAALEAYSLLKEYNLSLDKDEIYLTEEAKALKRWIRAYEDELETLGFIDGAGIAGRLSGYIEMGKIPAPGGVVLAGFDELTPSLSSFLRSLERRGAEIIFWPEAPGSAACLPEAALTIRPFADEEEEVAQAARWARKTVRPGVRIGFIVPELRRYRGLILREFAAELDPSSVLPGVDEKKVFNVSLGAPLYDEPLVSSALDILSIGEGKEELERFSRVFYQPFLAPGLRFELARIDAVLRRENRIKVSLYDIRQKISAGSDLKAVFDTWTGGLKAGRKKEPPSFWAGDFSRFLERIGWLCSVRLSSREFQALKAWNKLLEEFASLDDILKKTGRQEAVARLKGLALNAIHQPETPGAQIEVMGLLEAAGQRFDRLWILGCHQYALPAEPGPNPFIPLYLQRRFNLPHSSYERETAFATASLRRIFNSSAEIEVSYPKASEGRELDPSPLIRAAAGKAMGTDMLGSSRLKDTMRCGSSLEDIGPEDNIPVGEDELRIISGGTGIIKAQSLCPFKAFAEFRLNAKAIPTPELGITAAQRGDILHRTLNAFWEDAGSSAGLKALIREGRLGGRIKTIIDDIFEKVELSPLSSRFMEMEKERFRRLLNGWLEIEAERGPFRVKRIESEKEINIGGLRITGRPDRVDTLEDGRDVIIDYKSGDADKNDWATQRPGDPQLIIYCLGGVYDAVTFARLKPGDLRFIGISKKDCAIPGVKPFEKDRLRERFGGDIGWEGLMELWKNTIEGLAHRFLSGVADVDPNSELKGQRSPCHFCDLAMLCRIKEAELEGGGDEE